jgi:hypothetical protein
MGKDYDLEFFQDALKTAQDKCHAKAPDMKQSHRKAFVETCETFHDGLEDRNEAEADLKKITDSGKGNGKKAQDRLDECEKVQEKAMKKCVKAANKIFKELDIVESEKLEAYILKGTIIQRATPEALAAFVEEIPKKHAGLIKTLFKSNNLMKEMLLNGGAKYGCFGHAMKIYTDIVTGFPEEDDKFTEVNKKLAMAVALELASPIMEFDTKIEVDPVKRFQHYDQAHRNGELDPAFPHFTIWELRHVVNCDAKDDQLQWGRDMMMNYAPYITTITDLKLRYMYILNSDVLTRKATWTDTPRTYQQVLSGGGKDVQNAWFGRFICKAFGIPTWGAQQPEHMSMTRWTAEGWVAMLGASWDDCYWEDEWGTDFKAEVDARSSFTAEEYYQKLVLLEGFAEMSDGRRGNVSEEEKMILHPHRLWRSLAIIQKAVMLVPASPESFERSGEGCVKTKLETYLEAMEFEQPEEEIKFKKGVCTVPPSVHGFSEGNLIVIASAGGGQQLNMLADSKVEYELPVEIEERTYTLTITVCTAHLKQSPLLLSVDGGEKIEIEIPYTIGKWEKTEGVEIDLREGSTLMFTRERPSFGLAIKKFVLKPLDE